MRELNQHDRPSRTTTFFSSLHRSRLSQVRVPITDLMLAVPAVALGAKDSCFDCHSVMEGTSIRFKNDIHYKNGISCADCHGGDRNSDDPNISMSAQRGFKVRVTRDAVGQYCGRCHSDAAFMKRYNAKQRVDQMALYATSVHAGVPAGSDTVAATCVDCHGVHNTRAVSDPESTVAPARLARTCGRCHADTAALFQKSAHAPVFVTSEMASCATCHASHAILRVSGDMLAGGRAVCAKCHEPDSKGGRTAAALGRAFENAWMVAMESGAPLFAPPRGTAAGRGAGPPAGRGAGPAAGRGGPRASDPRLKKALSLVHSLDASAVKAAAEAGMRQR